MLFIFPSQEIMTAYYTIPNLPAYFSGVLRINGSALVREARKKTGRRTGFQVAAVMGV
jgi:hypothetical protein